MVSHFYFSERLHSWIQPILHYLAPGLWRCFACLVTLLDLWVSLELFLGRIELLFHAGHWRLVAIVENSGSQSCALIAPHHSEADCPSGPHTYVRVLEISVRQLEAARAWWLAGDALQARECTSPSSCCRGPYSAAMQPAWML